MTRANDAIGRTAFALAIGCMALVAVTVGVLAMPAARSRLGLGQAGTPAYVVGGRIDVPASIYDASPLTVVLFARSTCSACRRSQPLFARAVTALAGDPSVQVAMLTTPASRAGDVGYAAAIGIDERRLVSADVARLRVKIVPTLVLVDREGRIHYSHEGVPAPRDVDDLVRTATSLSQRH